MVALLNIGVPWDEIWNMSEERRVAFIVAHGEMNQRQFDWGAMQWKSEK